jgi:DNA gyrase/topoisomerase IV subunit A
MPDSPMTNEQIIERILSIAREEPTRNLLEMSAATLYPELYEGAAEGFGGWDGALAEALASAVKASARPKAAAGRARAARSSEEEQVERVVGPQAAEPLFARTSGGAFYKVAGADIPLSGVPIIAATPHGAGILETLVHLGEPGGVVVFSDRGRYFGIDVRMAPNWDGEMLDRRVQDVVRLEDGERIIGVLPREALHSSSQNSAKPRAIRERETDRLIHVTRQAKGKASLVSEMSYTLDRQGREAFLLNAGDAPVAVMAGPQKNSVFCASAMGKAIHFDAADIRTMGLQAVGVNVMKLDGEEDAVIGAFLGNGVKQVALITEHGLGKRVEFEEFRPQSRAGAGLQLLRLDNHDRVAAAVACEPDKDLAVLTSRGRVHRMPATDFARMGRPAKGNLQIDLLDDELVVGLAALPCGGAESE